MTPPPPQGYKLVTTAEIPIVPEGAMYFGYTGYPLYRDEWRESFRVGDKPCEDFQYAIPVPIITQEPQ